MMRDEEEEEKMNGRPMRHAVPTNALRYAHTKKNSNKTVISHWNIRSYKTRNLCNRLGPISSAEVTSLHNNSFSFYILDNQIKT